MITKRTYPWVSTLYYQSNYGHLVGMTSKVRGSLYNRVIIWVSTLLIHINTRVTYLGMKDLACYNNWNGIGKKKTYTNK